MICDTWHTEGGEHSLKSLGPLLLRFGRDSVLKIFLQRMTELISEKSFLLYTETTKPFPNQLPKYYQLGLPRLVCIISSKIILM